MDLTPEQRKQIYEEEKARMEGRTQLEKEAQQAEQPKHETKKDRLLTTPVKIVLLIIFVLLARAIINSVSEQSVEDRQAQAKVEHQKAAIETQKKADDAFSKLSTDGHVKEAQRLLSGNASRTDLETANKHISAISVGSGDSKLAEVLSAKADIRLKEIEKQEKAAKEEAEVNANPLTVVSSNWEKGGFGAVALWKVTFKNRSKKPVGNISYRTQYSSETGKVVDKGGVDSVLGSQAIMKVIPPGQTRTVEVNDGLISSEAYRASFEIVKWEFVSDQR